MAQGSSLWHLFDAGLTGATFTDLTHAFFPGQPHFAFFPDEERRTILDFASGDAFQVHRYGLVGQWGTHVDPPVHFVEGGRTLDAIPVSEMLLRLVIIDISARAATDPNAVPTIDDVEAWERRNGRIPERAFVALRSDWSKRWPSDERFYNRSADGMPQCPGWSRNVLTLLFEQRGITAIGHEQLDTDPGFATGVGDYSLERYVLSRDRWQLELLTNLDRVPEAGALIMATWPKAKDGSGFPARAVAIHR